MQSLKFSMLLILAALSTLSQARPLTPYMNLGDDVIAMTGIDGNIHVFTKTGLLSDVAEVTTTSFKIDLKGAISICKSNWKNFLQSARDRNHDSYGNLKNPNLEGTLHHILERFEKTCSHVAHWHNADLDNGSPDSESRNVKVMAQRRRKARKLSRKKRQLVASFIGSLAAGAALKYIAPLFFKSHTSLAALHDVSDHSRELMRITTRINDALTDLSLKSEQSYMYTFELTAVHRLDTALEEFEETVNAVRDALSNSMLGELRLGLIGEEQLLKTHKALTDEAKLKYLELPYSHAMQLLQMKSSMHFDTTFVVVHLHVPLIRHTYNLLRMEDVPLYLSDDTDAPARLAKVVVKKDLLAVDYGHKHEQVFSLEDLSDCFHFDNHYFCERVIVGPPASTCAGAIFAKDAEKAGEICDIEYSNDQCKAVPGNDKNSYVVTTTKELLAAAVCEKKGNTYETIPAGQKLINVKDGCSIHTECFDLYPSRKNVEILRFPQVVEWNFFRDLHGNRTMAQVDKDNKAVRQQYGSLMATLKGNAEAAKTLLQKSKNDARYIENTDLGFLATAALVVLLLVFVIIAAMKIRRKRLSILPQVSFGKEQEFLSLSNKVAGLIARHKEEMTAFSYAAHERQKRDNIQIQDLRKELVLLRKSLKSYS